MYRKGSVVSADGTTIGFRQFGSGPGVVLLHGSMLAAQDFMKLAEALADDFTVTVPDRRGRGLSGAHGADYGIEREVEDLQALLKETGASRVFGLSSGALIGLRTARVTPAIEKLALYEPPLSIHDSVPVEWLPRYRRELADGKVAAALVSVLKGLEADRVFRTVPRFILVPPMNLALRFQRKAVGDNVPIPDLVPTMSADMQLVGQLADTIDDYATIDADVLLLGGSRSPAYFERSLEALTGVLPRSKRITIPKLDHSGPTDDGGPAEVAQSLRAFFA
ncbi:pimeloyl-ACP methyl ester carboxylesterase [Kribbella rubisoli]|jgi:pimeloyl-ACP methyl ester carboxylesterase|uniref:Pimeloyl-ACP methyl ester carboxylesterase n=1 Tax=Kribbella rubisoli TaxID=3075929 RepID=A0A4Q7X158_9ACTN|nr:alpha/beta hydrolase [Kribbella rubisoli]RZU16025.1 pimeloyl-ACP methyl ester carboxylesterase [Kribbella rubisoli]